MATMHWYICIFADVNHEHKSQWGKLQPHPSINLEDGICNGIIKYYYVAPKAMPELFLPHILEWIKLEQEMEEDKVLKLFNPLIHGHIMLYDYEDFDWKLIADKKKWIEIDDEYLLGFEGRVWLPLTKVMSWEVNGTKASNVYNKNGDLVGLHIMHLPTVDFMMEEVIAAP